MERLHPHQLLTYLFLTGIFLVFAVLLLAFAGAQLYTIKEVGARLPVPFYSSTALLGLSSLCMWLAGRAQRHERYRALTAWLGCTLLLGVLFFALQLIAWNDLHLQGIYLNGAAAGSYLYVISGLHLLHVLAGLAFVLVVLAPASKAAIDPVSALVYSTDKYRQLQLRLLCTYWHFLGGVWAVMFLFFWLLLE